jgi:hypothetical protein
MEPFAFQPKLGAGQINIRQRPRPANLPQNLVAQFQFLRDGLVAFQILALQVIQQAPPLADHHQQPAPRAVVFFVALQMFRQMVDPLRQQRNLHIGRTRVAVMCLKLVNRLRFGFHKSGSLVNRLTRVKRIA